AITGKFKCRRRQWMGLTHNATIEHQRERAQKRKIWWGYGDKNENAGKLRRTEKIAATIKTGHDHFAGKNCPTDLPRNFCCANHAPRIAIAASKKINSALSLTAN